MGKRVEGLRLMQGVLLDTAYLITLSDPSRPNHNTAKDYYRIFIQKTVVMYLSTIVASEFQVRQELSDLQLQNFLTLPFNIDHTAPTALLTAANLAKRPDDYDRCGVKDDFKLLAQCQIEGITHFITDDAKCVKIIKRIRSEGGWATLPIPIYVGDPFDPAFFNPSNQSSFA